MGLDKWLKSEQEAKKKNTNKETVNRTKRTTEDSMLKKKTKESTGKLMKQTFTCTNAKCKYQRTIMKKQLTERDTICPRCSTKMKSKKV